MSGSSASPPSRSGLGCGGVIAVLLLVALIIGLFSKDEFDRCDDRGGRYVVDVTLSGSCLQPVDDE